MINRRSFLGTAMALPVASAASVQTKPVGESGWVTIAHSGYNSNQRSYSEASLEEMASGLKGKMVYSAGRDLYGDECQLSYLAGVVAETRITKGKVDIKVDWLTGKKATGMYLTPTGKGVAKPQENGYVLVGSYTPECVVANPNSAFQGASLVE